MKTIPSNHDAHWYNNGHTVISNDFTNLDTLEGNSNGTFCVRHNSTNSGVVLGSFDFCSSSGHFDINTGTISSNIAYCSPYINCWENVLSHQQTSGIDIFPNPVKENLTVNIGNSGAEMIQITDIMEKTVYSQKVNQGDEITIYRNAIPEGLYIIKVTLKDKSFIKKVIFE